MCLGGFKGAKQQPGASWTRAISAWGTKTASTEGGGGDRRMGRKAMTPITSDQWKKKSERRTRSQRRVDSVNSLVLVFDLVRALFDAVYNGDDGGGGRLFATLVETVLDPLRTSAPSWPWHCSFSGAQQKVGEGDTTTTTSARAINRWRR